MHFAFLTRHTILTNTYHSQVLIETCQTLTETIKYAASEVIQLLCDKDMVATAVRLMKELPTRLALQKLLCEMCLQCNEKIELRAGIENHNAHRYVIAILKQNTDILGTTLQTLASISSTTIRESSL